nr:hypothetical protein [uncultured Dongia sp.]
MFVRADRQKLKLLVSLVALFFMGGVIGAAGFKHIGFIATLFLAAILLVLVVVPIVDDISVHLRRLQRSATSNDN